MDALIGVDPYILRKLGGYNRSMIRMLSYTQAALIVYFYLGFTILSKYLLDVEWWWAFVAGLVPAAAFAVIFSFTLITWKTLAVKRRRTAEQVAFGFVFRTAYLGFLLVIASTFILVHQFPEWTQPEVLAHKQQLVENYESMIKSEKHTSIATQSTDRFTNSEQLASSNSDVSNELAVFEADIMSNAFFMHACSVMLFNPMAISMYSLLMLLLISFLGLYYYFVARSGSEYQLAEAALSKKLVHTLTTSMALDTNNFLRKKFDYLAPSPIVNDYFEDDPIHTPDKVEKKSHIDFLKALHGVS
jgi:hypothetical protein